MKLRRLRFSGCASPQADRRRQRARRFRRGCSAGLLGFCVLFGLAWALFPYPANRLEEYPAGQRIADRDGKLLRVFASTRGEFLFPVARSQISPWLERATIAVEDRRFRSHFGVDPVAVARALAQNLSRSRVHSGASTISQQLVRILDQRPRTLVSKLVESFHALQLESQRSKDQLITSYLNLAPYGGNLRGVEAASLRYFGKKAKQLTLSEAALLAGVPQSPSRFRLDRFLGNALRRREVVLHAMLREGMIGPEEMDAALKDIPRVGAYAWPLAAPHFTEVAAAEARARGGDSQENGVAVTTLDSSEQEAAERALRAFFKTAPANRGSLSGAAVVLDARTSVVRALVGSPNYLDVDRKGLVNFALRPRSPGSAMKPFLYALAFQRGISAPDAYVPDVPRTFATYAPDNFEGDFLGPISATLALSLSRNSPAVFLEQKVGVSSYLQTLRALGLGTLTRAASTYGLALALGGAEVRLVDLTNAYSALVRLGDARPWHSLSAGEKGCSVLTPGACACVLEMLSSEDHLRRAVPALALRWAGALGYKTGTSCGLRDAWAIAFTRELVVGIWIGSPSGQPNAELTGLKAAAPIALNLAVELSREPRPLSGQDHSFVKSLPVCPTSGYPVGRHCPNAVRGSAPLDAPRLPDCPVHREVLLDAASGLEVCANCRGTRPVSRRVLEVWPPDAGAAASSTSPLPQHDPRCRRLVADGKPRILSPAAGSEYRFEESLRANQRVFFTAAASGAARVLHWFVDGDLFASQPTGERVAWPLVRGRHEVRCVDDRGRASSVMISVR